MPQPGKQQICATSASKDRTCRNVGSLTHWIRPWIQPASSERLCQVLNCWATIRTPVSILIKHFQEHNFFLISLTIAHMFYFMLFSFFFFRFTPLAYGGSQARIKSELQLPAYTTDTAMRNLSRICNLHHSSRQCQILNLLSEPRDQTCTLMDISQVWNHWNTTGTPHMNFSRL